MGKTILPVVMGLDFFPFGVLCVPLELVFALAAAGGAAGGVGGATGIMVCILRCGIPVSAVINGTIITAPITKPWSNKDKGKKSHFFVGFLGSAKDLKIVSFIFSSYTPNMLFFSTGFVLKPVSGYVWNLTESRFNGIIQKKKNRRKNEFY